MGHQDGYQGEENAAGESPEAPQGWEGLQVLDPVLGSWRPRAATAFLRFPRDPLSGLG